MVRLHHDSSPLSIHKRRQPPTSEYFRADIKVLVWGASVFGGVGEGHDHLNLQAIALKGLRTGAQRGIPL